MKTAVSLVLALALIAFSPLRGAAESFASWSAKAAKAAKRRDNVAALEAYANALRLWKKADGKKAKAKVLAARAALYAAAGSAEAALQDLVDAVKLDNGAASTFYRKGRIELDMGRPSDAISDFYKAVKLNLNYREAYFYRGLAYERQGDAKFAREDYKTACRLGLKAACSESARAKAQTALASGGSEPFEAASGPEPGPGGKAEKPRGKSRRKLDWQACLDGLNACVEAGGAYGDCVKKARSCGSSSAKDCCPQNCLKRYAELVDQGTRSEEEGGLSEAAAFRQVFGEKPDCAGP